LLKIEQPRGLSNVRYRVTALRTAEGENLTERRIKNVKSHGCFVVREITRFLAKAWLLASFCFLFASNVQTHRAAAQSTEAQTEQQQISNILSNPALMTRVYSLFFTYQHHLDTVADQQKAAGKDASGLRRVLQNRLGFSDEEYKPIRNSCDQVATETKALSDEIRSNPGSRANFSEVRDQEINAEVTALASELSAKNKVAFETFLVRNFAPQQEIRKAAQQ
jgi:hypothetical protein